MRENSSAAASYSCTITADILTKCMRCMDEAAIKHWSLPSAFRPCTVSTTQLAYQPAASMAAAAADKCWQLPEQLSYNWRAEWASWATCVVHARCHQLANAVKHAAWNICCMQMQLWLRSPTWISSCMKWCLQVHELCLKLYCRLWRILQFASLEMLRLRCWHWMHERTPIGFPVTWVTVADVPASKYDMNLIQTLLHKLGSQNKTCTVLAWLINGPGIQAMQADRNDNEVTMAEGPGEGLDPCCLQVALWVFTAPAKSWWAIRAVVQLIQPWSSIC